MQRPLPVGLLVALLAVTAVVGAGVAAPSETDAAAPEAQATGSDPLLAAQSFESAQFDITVEADGDGRWLFRYTRPLTNESEREQFRAYADRFNSEETDLYRDFRNQSRRLVDRGAAETGRNMSATNYSREAFVGGLGAQGSLGVVEMRFTWEGFALVSADRVAIGDVFEGGLYIGPDQRLRINAGPGLQFEEVDPNPTNQSGDALADSDSVAWVGEREFADNRPRVVFIEESAAGGTPGGPTTVAAGAGSGAETPTMLVIGFVVVVLGLTGALAWRSGGLDGLLGGDGGDGGVAAEPAGESTAGTAAESASADAESEAAVSEEELLTDDARVVNLLEENGGRMKQVNIVEETGWSKSKVSMLLSEMEDDGDISKLRVGRENIISLAGNEPEAAGSPFEDEDDDE